VSLGYVGLVAFTAVYTGQGSVLRSGLPPLVATAAFAVLWLLLRGAPKSPRFVRAIELSTLVGGTAAFSTMALILDLTASPDMVVRTAVTCILLVYAVYVPSTAKHTLVVAGLMTLPLLGCIFVAFSAWDPALHDPPAAIWPKGKVGDMAYPATLVSAGLWAIAVAMAAAFSSVVHGLRKEVRDVRRLGQYTLEKKLGEGGMGVVYRASHAMLRRPTAIKLLSPDRAGKDALARFEREVRRTAMLTHPNTVTVFDYGRTTDGVFYYAMELLEGASLDEVVEVDGPQPEERVIHLLEQAAASLAEAHAAGLIHRDIKPANIMVVDRGGISDLVKVVDFGLVKDVGFREQGGETSALALSTANAITGTPLYIAPETLTAPETVDPRTDLYALGAVGYWLLTGTHVFGGNTVVEVCAHHLHTAPEPPSSRLGAAISPDLEALVLACLAKRPDERPASAQALRDRLRACVFAGGWTNARAGEWWTKHRHELRSSGAHAGAISATVDARAPHLTVTRVAD
jgi:serine/threonine-protein kinase